MARRKRNPSRQNRQFWESAFSNTFRYRMYYDRIIELAISRWEYRNLPDTVDPRFMELVLIGDGQAIYFNDEVIGDLCLRTTINGPLDLYDIPISRRAYSTNGYQRQLTIDDSVLIYNNYLHRPSKTEIAYYADRLSHLDEIIDININAQKTPILITADQNERFSMEQLYMKYEGNVPYIFGSKNLRPDSIKVMKTDAPFLADKLYQLKTDTWNEMLTWLGISNVSITKKERLITDEVQRSQGGTNASKYSPLEARRDAVEKINAMFGRNIEVCFRQELDTTMPGEPMLEDVEEEVTVDE